MIDATPDDASSADDVTEAETAAEDLAAGTLIADEDAAVDALTAAEAKAAEHLADLLRLKAEYVNYRKRVDRDREAVIDLAVVRVVESLIPVLDDIAAARSHDELDGPFAAIAEKFEAALGRLGWATYGAVGEPFDPTLHEALASMPDPEAKGPTVREVVQLGHRIGERVVRPARVVVAQPE